ICAWAAPLISSATPTVRIHACDVIARSTQASKVLVKPHHQSSRDIPPVLRLLDVMSFVRIDDELCLDAEGSEGVPELERLGGGNFAVAIADQHERRRLRILDVF